MEGWRKRVKTNECFSVDEQTSPERYGTHELLNTKYFTLSVMSEIRNHADVKTLMPPVPGWMGRRVVAAAGRRFTNDVLLVN